MNGADLIALKKTYGLQVFTSQNAENIKKKHTPKASSTLPKPNPARFYAALFKNLEKLQPLSENELTALARKRAEAVVSNPETAGGINASQIKTVESTGEG